LDYLLRRDFAQLPHDAIGLHRDCEKSAVSVFEEHDAKIAAVERRSADAKRMGDGAASVVGEWTQPPRLMSRSRPATDYRINFCEPARLPRLGVRILQMGFPSVSDPLPPRFTDGLAPCADPLTI
jgi:hypothetical protein